MLEDYDNGLPDILMTLQKEHDELRAELDVELAISQELENCDQDMLEDLRAELDAQTFVHFKIHVLTQIYHLIIMHSREELKEKERSQRALESEKQSLEAHKQELQGHIQEGEAALQADTARIAQSGGNTELGALRLERECIDRHRELPFPLLRCLVQTN